MTGAAGERAMPAAASPAAGMMPQAILGSLRPLYVHILADEWCHTVTLLDARTRRRHYDRCPACNPAGSPPPLPYGGEYHRRQRARVRRK